VERAAIRRAPRRGEEKTGFRELAPKDMGEPPVAMGSLLDLPLPDILIGGVVWDFDE
jgi:hypothetical protein